MKAVILNGEGSVKIQDVAIDDSGFNPYNDDVLIKVKYAGICGSDIALANADKDTALAHQNIPLGHEVVGIVEEVQDNVSEVSVGDRVVVYHTVGCGQCYQCYNGQYQFCVNGQERIGWERQGGMAEYISVPERNIVKIPDDVSLLQAVMCACNGGTIANAFGDLYKGSVSVIGLGSVGVCGIIYAQYNQKPPVIITGADTDDNRRSLVGKMFEWIPIETVPHYEANIILECSGSTSGRKKAIDLVLPNGLVCFIGYGEQELYLKPSDHMILKQVTMRGIYAMPYDVLWDLIGMDSTNGLDFTPAISEIMPLEDAPRAFEMIRKREAIKIILSLE